MDAISNLYSAVNEGDTPLPRAWSSKDKLSFLGLSNNSLRVHYKGTGKNQKDAASVRATYPIPTACGIYYFEVKVISKGRDGYMGIGLSTSSVSLNRLPGWDKNSYGYHGDDGHSFCSSGSGQTYGPTFTTGDVIGCCVNLIDGTCFYTKNGINLGIAFRGLPASLYPTVGLQTPGEVIEANFGNSPFVFDFEDYVREWRLKTKLSIERCSVSGIELPSVLQKLVSSYLVHHGYSETASSFANATRQDIEEDLLSIHNRQKIQKLVLAGQVGEAIECTRMYYPGLLESNASLLFSLKCRQFVEMVGGCDMQPDAGSVRAVAGRNAAGKSLRNAMRSTSCSVRHPTNKAPRLSGDTSVQRDGVSVGQWCDDGNGCQPAFEHHMNRQNSSLNGDRSKQGDDCSSVMDQDADYIVDSDFVDAKHCSNGSSKDCYANGKHDKQCMEDIISCDSTESGMDNCDDSSESGENMMGTDTSDLARPAGAVQQLCGGSREAIERMLQFGRELQQDSEQLKRDTTSCEAIKKSLKEVFSLLAYSNPWNSPVGYQLDPAQREPVCAALNSAILESRGLPARPPLEFAVNHSRQCLKLMAKANIGSCAFADITNYIQ